MATYKHIRSSTANKRPTTSIADGQLAINTNTASPGLFFKDSAGTGIVKVGPVHVGTTAPNATPAAGGSTGNYTGEQWLDTSVSPAQMKVWNGSAWVGVVADELPVSKLQDGAARQLLQTDAAGTGVEWTSNVDVPGTLDVTGATTLDSTLTVPLGSAASPTLRFSGDANSGLYSPGADQVAVATNGSGRLFVDASGNVGASATPSAWNASWKVLEFANGHAFGSSGVQSAIAQNLFNNSGGSWIYKTSAAATFYQQNNGEYIWYTAASGTAGNTASLSERMRLTSAGLVGVGTSAPGAKIDIVSDNNTSLASVLRVNSNNVAVNTSLAYDGLIGSGELFVRTSSASKLYLGTNNTNALTIDSTQRVGIGVVSPAANLHIQGTTGASLRIQAGSTSSAQIDLIPGGASNPYYVYVDSSRNFIFQDNASERLRIDSSGRLLIGASSASLTNKFLLQGDTSSASNGGYMRLQTANSIIAGTSLGSIGFGDSANNGALIEAKGDVSWSPFTKGSRLEFSTTADGASSPTERLRITSTGQVRLAGAGITFNGDTAAANELDDYEEGTWTPNQGAGLTVVGTFSSVGRYTKVGNLVYVTGYVSGSTSIAIAAGSILCSNLIFTQGLDGCGGNCTNFSVNQTAGLFATGGSTNLYATSALTASSSIIFGFTFRV
jgi:hypothetical protein